MNKQLLERAAELARRGESFVFAVVVRREPYSSSQQGDSAIITFDDYAIDLSQFLRKGDAIRRPRERSTWQLMAASDPHDPGGGQLARQSRAELFEARRLGRFLWRSGGFGRRGS